MVIKDDRTVEEAKATVGFIVAERTEHDRLAWDIGDTRMIFARPVRDAREHDVIMRVFRERVNQGYHKRVRYSRGVHTNYGQYYKPKLRQGDYLYVFGFNSFLPYKGHVLVGEESHLGEVQAVEQMTNGVTYVSTSSTCALLLGEHILTQLLPNTYHYRDNMWNAWVECGDKMDAVLEYFNLPKGNGRPQSTPDITKGTFHSDF